tara:strand:+ start:1622 stop:2251 length:630 start_codon:yes stop_codon:yes gene_type:complete
MSNLINKYFTLSANQNKQINMLFDLYRYWNNKVNLISRKDFEYFYERHVLHSLSICKVYSFHSNTRIMDLGTGGGFPGIPLAIMCPNVQFYLVDSIGKKIKAVESISKELKLTNTIVLNKRAEDVDISFDFIVTRAVSKLSNLDKLTANLFKNNNKHNFNNGLICLKGGDLSLEMKGFNKRARLYLINDFFSEEFFDCKKILHLDKKGA